MHITRLFTTPDTPALAGIAFKRIDVDDCHVNPARHCCVSDVEVPADWSYQAAQSFARHCLARVDIPVQRDRVAEECVPLWMQRSRAAEGSRTERETSARAVFTRLAGSWAYAGMQAGYFDTEEDAKAFYDECLYMLARQIIAPDLQQWSRTGIHWAYGLEGEASTGFVCNAQGKISKSAGAYLHPALYGAALFSMTPSAQEDALWNLAARDRKAIADGASVGAAWCDLPDAFPMTEALRLRGAAVGAEGEVISLIPALHPGAQGVLHALAEEQYQAACRAFGAQAMRFHLTRVLEAAGSASSCDPAQNAPLRAALSQARKAGLPEGAIERVLDYARAGFEEAHLPLYNPQPDRLAHSRVAFAISGAQWRTAQRSPKGRELLEDWAYASWATGSPALVFTDAAGEGACASSDLAFFAPADTARVGGAIRLSAFRLPEGGIDSAGLRQAARILTLVLDSAVENSRYPTRDMARQMLRLRPLNISLTGFSETLMAEGIAYDSERGRALAACTTSLVTAEAYATSAALAKEGEVFPAYVDTREEALRRLQQHRSAAPSISASALAGELRHAWDQAFLWAEAYGLRNAQVTALADVGALNALMDVSSAGIAPMERLVCTAPQASGGVRKYVHPAVRDGLQTLGYSASQCADVEAFLLGSGELRGDSAISYTALHALGFGQQEISLLRAALPNAQGLRDAFDPWVLGESFCRNTLHLTDAELFSEEFSLLDFLGFTRRDVAEVDLYACGSKTMCGAPHLKPEHLPVFARMVEDALQHEREITPEAVLRMMGAVQPGISGGVAQPVCLPFDAPMQAPLALVSLALSLKLKALSITRHANGIAERSLPAREAEAAARPSFSLAMDALSALRQAV